MSSLSTSCQCYEQACEGYRDAAYNLPSPVSKKVVKSWIQEWRATARRNPGFNAEALKNASYWAGYYAGLHKRE